MGRIPLYRQAEDEMRRRIADGAWPTGTRLGNEFELAAEFGVSQGTMRRALMTLEAEGRLARKPGRGTIVADAPAPELVAKAMNLTGPDGAAPDFEIHRAKRSSRNASRSEAALLGAGKVHVIERLLKSGGDRAALETLTVPAARIQTPDEMGPLDLSAFLAAHGLTGCAIEIRASARLTTMGESVTLSCNRDTALLVLDHVARNGSGQAVALQTLLLAKPGFSLG